MQDDGLRPDLVSCNTVLSACERGAQWEEAALLLRDMRETHAKGDGTDARPDAVSYHTTMAACRRARGSRAAAGRAILLRREMVRDGLRPNVVACTNAMAACVAAGRWRAALALFNRLRESGPAPDTFASNTALSACAAGGQWQRAMRILAAMGSEDSGAPLPPLPLPPPPPPPCHLHPATSTATATATATATSTPPPPPRHRHLPRVLPGMRRTPPTITARRHGAGRHLLHHRGARVRRGG